MYRTYCAYNVYTETIELETVSDSSLQTALRIKLLSKQKQSHSLLLSFQQLLDSFSLKKFISSIDIASHPF